MLKAGFKGARGQQYIYKTALVIGIGYSEGRALHFLAQIFPTGCAPQVGDNRLRLNIFVSCIFSLRPAHRELSWVVRASFLEGHVSGGNIEPPV